MKKLLIAPLVLLGACAACCALPLLAPLLAGLLTSSIGAALGGWQIGLVVLAIGVGAGLVHMVRRQPRPVHAATSCQIACKAPRDVASCNCSNAPQA